MHPPSRAFLRNKAQPQVPHWQNPADNGWGFLVEATERRQLLWTFPPWAEPSRTGQTPSFKGSFDRRNLVAFAGERWCKRPMSTAGFSKERLDRLHQVKAG